MKRKNINLITKEVFEGSLPNGYYRVLNKDEAIILGMRYGIYKGYAPMPIDEIAKYFGVSVVTIREKEKDAIVKLIQCCNGGIAKFLVKTVVLLQKEKEERQIAQHRAQEDRQKRLQSCDITIEELFKYSEEFNYFALPAHVERVIRNSGIKTLKELLSMTEDELLQIKGFGRRALEYLEKELNSLGHTIH